MKKTKRTGLWYNPKAKAARTVMLEGGEMSCLDIEHLAQSEEGRSLLASYCRVYSSAR